MKACKSRECGAVQFRSGPEGFGIATEGFGIIDARPMEDADGQQKYD